MKNCSWWALLPLLYSLSTAAGLWLVYFVAVHNENVTPLSSHTWRFNGSLFPPYISVAGNFPPASCIFSEVTNLSAFGGCVLAVLRHLQLSPALTAARLNHFSLAAFVLACGGMTLLGNFQLFSQEAVHNLGTSLTFGLGTLYCWLQAVITRRADLWGEGAAAAVVRFLLSACISLCLLLYFLLMWQHLHMHAARCQWALVSFFLLFISTFALEFRHSSFHLGSADVSAPPLHQSDPDDPSGL